MLFVYRLKSHGCDIYQQHLVNVVDSGTGISLSSWLGEMIHSNGLSNEILRFHPISAGPSYVNCNGTHGLEDKNQSRDDRTETEYAPAIPNLQILSLLCSMLGWVEKFIQHLNICHKHLLSVPLFSYHPFPNGNSAIPARTDLI